MNKNNEGGRELVSGTQAGAYRKTTFHFRKRNGTLQERHGAGLHVVVHRWKFGTTTSAVLLVESFVAYGSKEGGF